MGRWQGGVGCSIYRNEGSAINSDATFMIFVSFRGVFDHTCKALRTGVKPHGGFGGFAKKKGMNRFALMKQPLRLRAFLELA